MRRRAVVLLGLCLLLSGCTMARQAAENAANSYELYYGAPAETALGGDALQVIATYVEGGKEMEEEKLAKTLVEQLLAGPDAADHRRLIPKGVSLVDLELKGARAYVDLSAAYRSLSGIALTLADYSITLTLTQLPSVAVVSITVQGQDLAYRSTQSFASRDVLMTSEEDVVGTLVATLWFRNTESGQLTAEERTLELYEGDTQAAILLEALLGEPEGKGLVSALPEDFGIVSAWMEENICYINLPGAALTGLGKEEIYLALRALTASVDSLESVEHVQFKVDGESRSEIAGIVLETLEE